MNKGEVTQLLIRLRDNEEGVYDRLYPLVYDELRRIAFMQMQKQTTRHTFSKTDLVHETYLKLISQKEADFKDRSHFLAIASQCMRHILISYARKKHALKRGGKHKDKTYIDKLYRSENKNPELLISIDTALNDLAQKSERLYKVVEMRFFGEMTINEIATAMDVSKSTVKRDWEKARGWLYKELKEEFEIV